MGFLKKGLIQVPQSGGSAEWGAITGTLSNQVDLQNALNNKEPKITVGLATQFWNGLKQFVNITADNVVTNSFKRFISDADFNFFTNKAEKRELISFTYERNRQGFSTNITSSASLINLLQYLIGTPAGTVSTSRHEQQLNQTVDFTFNTTNPLSPILIFPVINGEVEYKIRISINGNYFGPTTTTRIMPVDIQRVSDNSLLGGVKHIKDLGDNNIVNEFIELTTRTIGSSDNFSLTGNRLLLQQNTGATLTLNKVQLYISANVIKLYT